MTIQLEKKLWSKWACSIEMALYGVIVIFCDDIKFKLLKTLHGLSSTRFVRVLGGLNPPLVPLNPQASLTSKKIVKNSQKYIADPLLFYHKSSTGLVKLWVLI